MLVARDSARILGTQVASAAFGAVYFLLLTRWFSPNDMAGLAVFGLVTGLAQIASNLGLGNTCIQKVPELRASGKEAEARGLMRMALAARLIASAAAAVVVWLAAEPLGRLFFKAGGVAGLLRVAAAGALAASVLEALQHLLWALQRFDVLSRVMLVTNIPVRLVALAGFAWGGIHGYLAIVVAGQVALSAWMAGTLRSELRGDHAASPATAGRPAATLRYSLPFYANGFGRYAGLQADQWLAGVFLPPRMLALYYVVRRFADYLILLADALFYPLSTRLAQLKPQGLAEVGRAFRRAARLTSMVLLPTCGIVAGLAYPLLRVYGAGRYVDGVPLLVSLAAIMTLYGPYGLYATGAYILGRPATRLAYESLNGAANLALGIVLMSWFSLAGLVAAKGLALVATLWLARRLFRRQFVPPADPPGIEFRTWRDVALASLGVAVILSAGWLIPPRAVTVPLTTLAALAGGVWFMLTRLTGSDLATIREAFPGGGERLAVALERLQARFLGRNANAHL